MSDVKKIFTLFIIFMMLFNPVLAADTGQQKEKVIDDTKEKETKIINKDKSITGDIKVTTKDVSKFSVKKKSNYEISISKSGEHAKAKVSFPKSELQKIDIDGDGKFGLLHISDNGEVTHTTATEAELVAGKVMTFSTNIVNGYSGYKQYTFSDVESGDILNIDDVSGNYTVTAAVDGVVPTYTAGIPSGYAAKYDFETYNATSVIDVSGNGHTADIYNNVRILDGTFGKMYYGNTSGYLKLGVSNEFAYNNWTVVFWTNNTIPFSSATAIFTRPPTGAYTMWIDVTTTSNKMRSALWDSTHNPQVISSSALTPGKWECWILSRNTTTDKIYMSRNAVSQTPVTDTTAGVLTGSADTKLVGGDNMVFDNVIIYPYSLNSASSLGQIYAGGSGISFQPEPSYNFTGYDASSGVEKVLNTDSTCTGIEYVDTTGGTHDVTITVYFTEDITVISDSHTATMRTVNISHTSSNTAHGGELIPYDILDEYFGTIDFDTTNPNATITRNATHFMVDTGYITANTTYYYNVSIPNYIEEMVWSDWDPTNETCNAKVQIGNSTPYTTWNITTFNVTNGSLYKLVYAGNGTEVGNATAANGSASIIILGLVDGVYWLTETPVLTGFINVPAVAVTVVIVAGGAIGASFIGQWYRKRRK